MDRNQEAFKTAALIREIYSRVSSQIVSGMSGSGLSHQQIMVVRLLAHNKTLQISALCHEMSLSKGTVSGILNRMERDGLIEKTKDPKDKRNTYIRFTAQGNEFAKSYRGKIVESYTQIFINYTDEELLELQNVLTDITVRLPKLSEGFVE